MKNKIKKMAIQGITLVGTITVCFLLAEIVAR